MSNTSKLDKFFYHNILQNNKLEADTLKKNINPDFTPWNMRNLDVTITPEVKTIKFQDNISKYLHSSNLEFTPKKLNSSYFADIIDILSKWHMTQNLKEDMFHMFLELLNKFGHENPNLEEVTKEFDILWEHWKHDKCN